LKVTVKKNARQYIIDFYDLRKKEDEIFISGYDVNGVYFQMKHKGKYRIVETEASTFIYLFI
jgi:hypothetical protein